MFWPSVILSSLLIVGSYGHEWGFGSCSTVAPFRNFDIDKFLGLWYVMEQFDTSSTCLALNFTRVSETQLRVTKHRQIYFLDKLGMDHTNSYTGSLDIPYSSNPAMLRVKWPLNAAGKGDYIVFDTDYTTYAGIYDCQQITFFAFRESAAILSRTPTLDETIEDTVRELLATFKVDVSELNKIDHSSCRNKDEADLRMHVDQSTFKNFFYRSVDSIKSAANKVTSGVTTTANYIVDKFKSKPSEAIIVDINPLSKYTEY